MKPIEKNSRFGPKEDNGDEEEESIGDERENAVSSEVEEDPEGGGPYRHRNRGGSIPP